MTPFDFHLRTQIVAGEGILSQLGSWAARFQPQRVLVVSDPGIVAAGHVKVAVDSLVAARIETRVFDQVRENPDTSVVEQGLQVAREFRPDLLVGLGGGSSMDAAKGINFLYSCGGRMQNYWGLNKATADLLPMIAVPTTGGTGSETQSFALISDAVTHVKMACGDKRAAFRLAMLDPVLTLSQPPRTTALTGIDALSHALETYVTRSRNPASLLFSRQAWLLLMKNLPRVFAEPQSITARAAVQLGACWAGVAIEHSMLGLAHALANPLTAKYGLAHGQAIGILLPHVILFNGEEVGDWYRQLLQETFDTLRIPPVGGFHGIAELLQSLLVQGGLATSLRECGVATNDLPQLAEAAAQQWTAGHNPRTATVADLQRLYEQAM